MGKGSDLLESERIEAERVWSISIAAEQAMGIHGQFEIRYVFDPGADGDDTYPVRGQPNLYSTTAVTTPRWQYKQARIRWFLRMTAQQTDEAIFATAVHELMHVLLDPITSSLPLGKPHVEDLNEFVTESLTRAFVHGMGRPLPERGLDTGAEAG